MKNKYYIIEKLNEVNATEIEIENEDVNINDLMLEVSRQIRNGNTSGVYPNWEITGNYNEE